MTTYIYLTSRFSEVTTYIFLTFRFSEVKGMTEVNDKEFPVTVIGPYTFSIGNTTGFSDYVRGGVALQVRFESVFLDEG